MEPLKQAYIQTKTDLHALTQVLAWFDALNDSTIPRSIWLQCQLALAEGFTNAVRHAHKNHSVETAIDIEVKIFTQHLEIRIWDKGLGFDLAATLSDMPSGVDPQAVSGRGLKLIKQVVDVMSYTRTEDQRNCLLLIKYSVNC